jgi:hypothetical protein
MRTRICVRGITSRRVQTKCQPEVRRPNWFKKIDLYRKHRIGDSAAFIGSAALFASHGPSSLLEEYDPGIISAHGFSDVDLLLVTGPLRKFTRDGSDMRLAATIAEKLFTIKIKNTFKRLLVAIIGPASSDQWIVILCERLIRIAMYPFWPGTLQRARGGGG